MNVSDVNEALFRGELGRGVLPHLDGLARWAFRFRFDFGLNELPKEPGILIVRGARQYGKSTWLEGQIRSTIEEYGRGSAFYLNGDTMTDPGDLAASIGELAAMFSRKSRVRRLFIDEITSVKGWERALKRVVDSGALRDVLVVTTGSKATDLRRGTERLPGRKGRLARTNYLFLPISFCEFRRVCGDRLQEDLLPAYILSGGSPPALNELAEHRRLGEFVVEMVRDWIFSECAAVGRSRSSLLAALDVLLRLGGSPVGQARLAREAGLANNTVAAGYVELLADLTVLGISHPWDASRGVLLRRRPAKYPFTNLLGATCFHPERLRSPDDFRALDAKVQGAWLEWLIAQELWRRKAKEGSQLPEQLPYWSSPEHELDFVRGPDHFIEVKRGRTGPLDFGWFSRCFPRGRLTVLGGSSFATDRVVGKTIEAFLLED